MNTTISPEIEKEKKITSCEFEVVTGVWRLKEIFVNMFIVQNPSTKDWILIDAGLKTSGPGIKELAKKVLQSVKKPKAIILTHGHFDHRGSLKSLADEWNVPIYCHPLEMPYLNGSASYPPPDPTVGGGMMSFMAFAYPKQPINVSEHLKALPEDSSVPFLEEWKWIHTPGHTPGHISLFREHDRVLIAGDAFVTTKQESAYSVMTQQEEVCGPPKYFTSDWKKASESVKTLSLLKPEVVASGHGHSLYGKNVKDQLQELVKHFEDRAVPAHGRYVETPASFDEDGPTYIPPAKVNYSLIAVVTGIAAIAGAVIARNLTRK